MVERIFNKLFKPKGKVAAEGLGNIGDVGAGEPLVQQDEVEVLIKSLDERVERTEWDPDRGEEIGWVEWPHRYFAIKALGKRRDPRAVVPLSNLLKSGDTNLTDLRQAVEALGEIGDVKAVDPLIQVLGDDREGDPDFLRSMAANALGKIGDKRAIEPLVPLLKNESYTARMSTANALEKLGWQPKDDVEKAYYLVAKRDWNELVKLAKAGDEKIVVEPLIQFFKNLDASSDFTIFSEEIAATFGKIGERIVEPLIQALKNENSNIREGVATSLGKIGDKRAVDLLIHALRDESHHVRRATAEALGNIGDERATEPLIQFLKDKTIPDYARKAGVISLGKIGDERATEPLITALEDMNLAKESAEALGNIRDERATEPLIRALKHYASPPREEIAEALGNIGDVKAVGPLVQLLKDESYSVQKSAAEALEKLGWQPKDDIEKAYYLVAKRDWDELVELGKAGDEATIEALGWALVTAKYINWHPEWYRDIRMKALEALGEIGNVRAVNYLKNVGWFDIDKDVQKAAKEALKKIEQKE